MSSRGEYVRFGDSAVKQCVGGQTQYNSRYLTGIDGRATLDEDLDWVDDPLNYHGIVIREGDACILAGRIVKHEILAEVISEENAPTIPCDECPFADIVKLDQAG